jgi:hypothetical protein
MVVGTVSVETRLELNQMDDQQFSQQDHLAWSRFMLANVLALTLQESGDQTPAADRIRNGLSRAWEGLGAQGVEGAMLSMTLTLEAFGCRIISSQISPESSELVVEHFPGAEMLGGLEDRFDIAMTDEDWHSLMAIDQAQADRIYDILGAIADGAGVEFLRDETADGNVRLLVRAW